jgi:hypothetical protein
MDYRDTVQIDVYKYLSDIPFCCGIAGYYPFGNGMQSTASQPNHSPFLGRAPFLALQSEGSVEELEFCESQGCAA